MALSALIIDADRAVRQHLHQLLLDQSDVGVIAEAAGLIDGVRAADAMRPDAVFLGVRTGDEGALDAVGLLPDGMLPATVIVADNVAYAVRAFDIGATYCLTLPVRPECLRNALTRLRDSLSDTRANAIHDQRIVGRDQRRRQLERVALPDGRGFTIVDASSIRWVEALGNYVHVHTDGRSYRVRRTLADMATRLDAERFRRISRGSIVNVDFVEDARPGKGGNSVLTMIDGTVLTVSPQYSRSLFR